MRLKQNLDAASRAGLTPDEPGAFEGEDHLMDGGRRDAEMALQVGFGRWSAEHLRVGVDEGQILALLRRESGSG